MILQHAVLSYCVKQLFSIHPGLGGPVTAFRFHQAERRRLVCYCQQNWRIVWWLSVERSSQSESLSRWHAGHFHVDYYRWADRCVETEGLITASVVIFTKRTAASSILPSSFQPHRLSVAISQSYGCPTTVFLTLTFTLRRRPRRLSSNWMTGVGLIYWGSCREPRKTRNWVSYQRSCCGSFIIMC